MERKRHYAVEKLSPQAKGLIDAGLGDNRTYQQIVDTLKAATGEKLPISSLQRYHAKRWFPMRAALEETDRLYGLVKETLEGSKGKKFDEVTSEIAKAMLFKVVAALKDPDPYALYQLVISEGRLGVEKEKVGISREKLKLEEEKVKVLQGQLQVAREKIEGARAKAREVADEISKRARAMAGVEKMRLEEAAKALYGIGL